MFEDSPNAKYILIGIAAVAVALLVGSFIGTIVGYDTHYHYTTDNYVSSHAHLLNKSNQEHFVLTTEAVIYMIYNESEPIYFEGEFMGYDGAIIIRDPKSGAEAIFPRDIFVKDPYYDDYIKGVVQKSLKTDSNLSYVWF